MLQLHSFQPAFGGNKKVLTGIITMILSCVLAFFLKKHYSQASVADLGWILTPTVWLTSSLSGMQFSFEPALGYVNDGYQIIVVSGCAGVNFFTALFLLISFVWLPQKMRDIFLNTIKSFVLAYGVTIVVNSMRIIASAFLFQTDVYTAWLSAEKAHRILGIILYFSAFLLVYFGLVSQRPSLSFLKEIAIKNSAYKLWLWAVPFLGYIGFTLLVPILHNPKVMLRPAFLEHAFVVTLISGVIVLVVYFLNKTFRQLSQEKRFQ